MLGALVRLQRMGQQHVDAVAGIDEARHGGGRRRRHADGAQAGLEHGGQEAARARHHDVGLDDRLADMERGAGDGADEVGERPAALDDVGWRQRARGPRLPAQILGLDELAHTQGVACHQHLRRRLGRDSRLGPAHLGRDRRALGLQPGAREEGRRARDDHGEQQENDAFAVHDAPPVCVTSRRVTGRPTGRPWRSPDRMEDCRAGAPAPCRRRPVRPDRSARRPGSPRLKARRPKRSR